MFNVTRNLTFAIVVACLLQLSLGASIPTRTVKEDIAAARRSANFKKAPLASSRFRQTNAREIRARNIIRNDPLYRRQQASARVYPTCSADFGPLFTSARYVGSNMAGGGGAGGSYYSQPFEAYSEEECYEVATEQPGAIGYYWSVADSICSLKFGLGAPETWKLSNDPQSVTVLFGDCNAFNGAGKSREWPLPMVVPGQFQNTCCGLTGEQTYGSASQQCSPRVPAPLPVARFAGRGIYGYDFSAEDGGMPTVTSEAQCIQACYDLSGCQSYQYWPQPEDRPANLCWLKTARASSYNLVEVAQDGAGPGAVAGTLEYTCENLQRDLDAETYQGCCNN